MAGISDPASASAPSISGGSCGSDVVCRSTGSMCGLTSVTAARSARHLCRRPHRNDGAGHDRELRYFGGVPLCVDDQVAKVKCEVGGSVLEPGDAVPGLRPRPGGARGRGTGPFHRADRTGDSRDIGISTDGIEIFPLALGCNGFGWISDESASAEVLDAYVSAGGNLIDTADGYSAWASGNSGGESELIIGRWMAARKNRDRLVVTTKVGRHPQFPGMSGANVRAAADASLARLRTDRIDIYYAHFDDRRVPIEETAGAFDALVRAGKVRAIGVSHYSATRIRQWIKVARSCGFTRPTVMQPHYSLVSRDAGEPDLVAVAADEGLSVVPYFTSSSGLLTGRHRSPAGHAHPPRAAIAGACEAPAGRGNPDVLQTIALAWGVKPTTVALAWIRTRPGVVAPIVNARSTEHLSTVIRAASLELDDDERKALDEISSVMLV
jgi:aryl-alcohol dehydrogenase-like predicted oxidoreductase